MSLYENEISKRRTFAIISHPDAGKTTITEKVLLFGQAIQTAGTLTEKFLLYGGAINQAGSVKGRKTAKHAVSDWMEIEKQRGISVTSSVLQFHYEGYCINILDTPGHQDFSEDTYRTLMAADSAVMVIDASKGVEAQTIKLFKVCVMRHIPIFTFINKLDREANAPFDLMDEIERVLGIKTCPINWPIGCGKNFKGVYDRNTNKITTFVAADAGMHEIESHELDVEGAEDQVGIIAKVCTYLAENKLNILDISQTIIQGYFNMMMIIELQNSPKDFGLICDELENLGKEIGVNIKLQHENIFNKMHRI